MHIPGAGSRKPLASVSNLSTLLLLLAVAVAFSAVAVADEPSPALPRVYIDTTWNPPTGATFTVNDNSTLQMALAWSQPGDTIVLNNTSVYTGNFVLPAKSSGIEQDQRFSGRTVGQSRTALLHC